MVPEWRSAKVDSSCTPLPYPLGCEPGRVRFGLHPIVSVARGSLAAHGFAPRYPGTAAMTASPAEGVLSLADSRLEDRA